MPLETSARTEKRRTIVFLVTCVVFALLAAPFRPGIVLGESMAPAFHSGQVFVTARVRSPEVLERGDVVLISLDGQLLLKRIYALGGDRIWGLRPVGASGIERLVSAPQLAATSRELGRYPATGDLTELVVPDGHIYVVGDSQPNSLDSRHFGPVPAQAIRGRVVISRLFRLWGVGGGEGCAMAQERPQPLRH